MMTWKEFTDNENKRDKNPEILKRLAFPKGKIDVVLDTDTYNEIDDQFALAYMVKSDDKLNTKAIYAAPFFNQNSTSPKDGMERSYEEIKKLLTLIGKTDIIDSVFKGSETYLPNETTPVISDAANDLAKRAMEYTPENPLYVATIGAITNIASAVLINPEIINRIVVVWLGGNAKHWPHNGEFNSDQDIAAARVIFNSKLALVQAPCRGVVSTLAASKYELIHHLSNKNPLCDYLLKGTIELVESLTKLPAWTKVLWDISTIAWLLNERFVETTIEHTPIPQYDKTLSFDSTRHFYRYMYHINRDAILSDVFQKLAK